jgi:hypothetical protein
VSELLTLWQDLQELRSVAMFTVLFHSHSSFFFPILGIELMSLYSLGTYFTIWAIPSVFLERGLCFLPGLQFSYVCLHLCVITEVWHHFWLIDWDWVLLNFCLGSPWTLILPISVSQVARITGMSYHPQPHSHRCSKMSYTKQPTVSPDKTLASNATILSVLHWLPHATKPVE